MLDFYEKCHISSTVLFDVILTDNDSEMNGLPLIDKQEEIGLVRLKVFYCDLYRINQKGGCESNHVLIRCLYEKKEKYGRSSRQRRDPHVLPRQQLSKKIAWISLTNHAY